MLHRAASILWTAVPRKWLLLFLVVSGALHAKLGAEGPRTLPSTGCSKISCRLSLPCLQPRLCHSLDILTSVKMKSSYQPIQFLCFFKIIKKLPYATCAVLWLYHLSEGLLKPNPNQKNLIKKTLEFHAHHFAPSPHLNHQRFLRLPPVLHLGYLTAQLWMPCSRAQSVHRSAG